MPNLDSTGCQPTNELIRQFLEFSVFYNRKELSWIDIQVMLLVNYIIKVY